MTLRRTREADNSVLASLGVPVAGKWLKTAILEGRNRDGTCPLPALASDGVNNQGVAIYGN